MARGDLIQLRRGTEAQWIAAESDDVDEEALADGEVGLVIDGTGAIQYLVIGDDEVEFEDLPKFFPGEGGGGGGVDLGSTIAVVDAGVDLGTARPEGAAAVYWRFSAGVDPGEDGVNVTNGLPGDIYYVAT